MAPGSKQPKNKERKEWNKQEMVEMVILQGS
jgi:hypothetical protein